MITFILLTSIAVIVLLIGFFEIRLPFIHKKVNFKKKKAATTIKAGGEQESGFGPRPANKTRFFIKNIKNDLKHYLPSSIKTLNLP